MEKSGMWILALGALGIGAYLLFSNQNNASGELGGSPGGGPAASNPFNFNFNNFFNSGSGGNSSGSVAAKKAPMTSQSLAAQGTPGMVSQVLLGGTMINAPRAQPYGFNFLASPPLYKPSTSTNVTLKPNW